MDPEAKSGMLTNYTPTTEVPVEHHKYDPWVTNAFITVDAIHITLTILGNLIVIWCIWHSSHLRVPAYLYVTSVAVSHMLVGLFVIPMFIVNHFPEDAMSTGVCVTLQFLGNMASTASPFSAIALALHQYRQYAGVHQYSPTYKKAGLELLMVWVLAALYAIKDAIVHDMVEEDHVMGNRTLRVYMCEVPEKYQLVSNVFILANFILLYLVPFLVMLTVYASLIKKIVLISEDDKALTSLQQRQRRNLLITVLVVLSAFASCFLGNYVWAIYVYWGPGFFENSLVVKNILQLVAFAQGWLNVLLIITLNEAFRKALKRNVTIKKNIREINEASKPDHKEDNVKENDKLTNDICENESKDGGLESGV